MKFKNDKLMDTSAHYYVPLPEKMKHLLYYPISVGYFDCLPSYSVERNVFSSFLLLVMMQGDLVYQVRRGSGVVHAGEALLLDCNQPHFYKASGPCSFTFIHFDGAQSREIFDDIENRCGNVVRTHDAATLLDIISTIMQDIKRQKRINEARTSVMLYSMLLRLLENSGGTGEGLSGTEVVDQAISYIQQHLTDNLDVENIAAHVGYSPSYFSHVFSRKMNMSPYQFVIISRIEKAQHLLQTTEMSVQEIAFQTGFTTVAHFSHTFRKHVGKTPQAYRKLPMM
ncbi:MAG: AraC family transcriptional regulator [Clostridiales bacterium]|nr:AraC family transcriptional regulator [Clostridiales bacterium]